MSEHKHKTLWLVDEYFPFFRFPYFLDEDFREHLYDEWDQYFTARKMLKNDIKEKDEKIDSLNTDAIKQSLSETGKTFESAANSLENVLSEMIINMESVINYLRDFNLDIRNLTGGL